MRKQKLYDMIYKLLTKYPELRDSDKKLMWSIWYIEGYVKNDCLTREGFYKASKTESIRRARQLVMADHSEVKSSKQVEKEKKAIERQKGTHAYREVIDIGFKSLQEVSNTLFELPKNTVIYQD